MSTPFFKFFLTNAKSQCEKSHDIWYAQCVHVRPSEIYYSMRRRSPNRNIQKIHSLLSSPLLFLSWIILIIAPIDLFVKLFRAKIYKKEGTLFPFFLVFRNAHANILDKQSQMLSHYHLLLYY